jgi:hypothetical protein
MAYLNIVRPTVPKPLGLTLAIAWSAVLVANLPSANSARRNHHDCGVVLCGGGPAGTAVIVCAAEEGRLDELLDHGIMVIEKGDLLAAGSIGHYRIRGNTAASSFVQWLSTPGPRSLFPVVATHPATEALLRRGSEYPPLNLVGAYLERLGASLQQILESHERCTVALRTVVRSVCVLAEGGVRVTAEPLGDPAGAFSVTASHAVIAMGGCEPPGLETLSLLPRLTLAEHESKVCHASALIDDRLALPPQLVEAVRETRSVVVVGGSHSGWSAAWVLLHDPSFLDSEGKPPQVTILHRRRLLFFYPTVAAARAAGYPFDDVLDVCASTGNVHRFAGLRSDARALALAVAESGKTQPPVRTVRLVDEPEVRSEVRRALDAAGLVVAAVGYHSRLPELAWDDGRRLEPAVSETGLVVTPEAALVTTDGTVVPEILVFGLGAGLAADSGFVCEPSYQGRFDGVRVYQSEVGRVALRSLLGEQEPRHPASASRARYDAAS